MNLAQTPSTSSVREMTSPGLSEHDEEIISFCDRTPATSSYQDLRSRVDSDELPVFGSMIPVTPRIPFIQTNSEPIDVPLMHHRQSDSSVVGTPVDTFSSNVSVKTANSQANTVHSSESMSSLSFSRAHYHSKSDASKNTSRSLPTATDSGHSSRQSHLTKEMLKEVLDEILVKQTGQLREELEEFKSSVTRELKRINNRCDEILDSQEALSAQLRRILNQLQ